MTTQYNFWFAEDHFRQCSDPQDTHSLFFLTLTTMVSDTYEVLVHSQPILGTEPPSTRAGKEVTPQNQAQKTSPLCSFPWGLLEGTWSTPCGGNSRAKCKFAVLCHPEICRATFSVGAPALKNLMFYGELGLLPC